MPKEVALLSVLFSLWIAGFWCEIIKRTLALGIYIVEVLVINCSTSPFFFNIFTLALSEVMLYF